MRDITPMSHVIMSDIGILSDIVFRRHNKLLCIVQTLGNIRYCDDILEGGKGMFLSFIWCIIGGFVAAMGFICALVKSKKSLLIALSALTVVAVVTVFLLVA